MGKIYKIKIDSEVFNVEIEEVDTKKTRVEEKIQRENKIGKDLQESKTVEQKTSQEVTKEVVKEESIVEEKTLEPSEPVVEPVENVTDFVLAPLPGKILKVLVQAGQNVKRGSVLLTIDAMKMENEIFAPFDGKVLAVYIKPGDKVETNKKLLKLGR
ncbi:MAG: biotin/lipoyl-binding protein [Caldisericaceae bacterium]